ncbi:hypothetical protein J5N97_018707 [Dioscorea zingiberensis]|uniref:MIF4G domain-containing protein n=1 Tax=Dioscorea zingiberensis TaxID=325984 RepID=A0A9D5CDE3_9LILI|nr:hypothetical protein J5N97_018707 [Dioscorea zingiberensis]
MVLEEMHRAETRYEVGRVFGKQEAKQRQLTSILNKLTPQNFENLFERLLEVNISDVVTLTGFVSQIVWRVTREPLYCQMYAEFCCLMNDELLAFSNNKTITVKRLVLNECQNLFEGCFGDVDRGMSKLSEEDKGVKKSDACVQFIGELFKVEMIHSKIMHHCISVLLAGFPNPEENNIEALCLLMRTAGEMLDYDSGRLMDMHFNKMLELSTNPKLSYHVRFMLMNAIDLRKNEWKEKRKIDGPYSGYGSREHQISRPSVSGTRTSLVPCPLTPLAMLHKAERRYEVRRVFGIEDGKQRKLRSILNKLTPQNLPKLCKEVKKVNINAIVTLSGFVSQIFHKILFEPTYCELYANFCFQIAFYLPSFSRDNKAVTFLRLLINKCQEEFERRDRAQSHMTVAEEEDIGSGLFEVDRKVAEIQKCCRRLGNIQFIGELCKLGMLSNRIVFYCINSLLAGHQSPNDEDIEVLCKLMSTVGQKIDLHRFKEYLDGYFDIMKQISTSQKLSSRIKFMLLDVIDLRKNGWQGRRKIEELDKTEAVYTMRRDGSSMIDISSSSSDEDDEDLGNHFSNSTCLDVKVKRKEIRVDGDCYILEYDPFQSVTIDFEHKLALNNDQEQDIIIVAEKGQVACRDYPHSRHLCAQYPFNTTPHEYTCSQCYCYICDEPAPCRIWHGDFGHCHASDQDRTERNPNLRCVFDPLLGRRPRPSSTLLVELCFSALKSKIPARTSSAPRNLDEQKWDQDLNLLRDDDRWTKLPRSFGPGQEIRHGIGHGATAMNLRRGQGITHGARKQHDKYGNETTGKKKYSRRFLLTFSEQCTQLPIGFEIGSDVINAVMSCPHKAYISPGRTVDRSSGSTRVDRRTIGIVDDDRWTKSPGSFGSGQEIRHDIGHGATSKNLRPGQLVNLIDISSDEDEDEDEDEEDLGNHFSNSTCLDVDVKRKEIKVDEDCYILEYDPFQSVTVDFEHKLALNNDQEQDIIIVAEKGQVACRDYPHSRHLCAQYPFKTTPHEYSCTQCYCYICDEPAPCKIWQGFVGHCHASDQDRKWVDLRATFRARLR